MLQGLYREAIAVFETHWQDQETAVNTVIGIVGTAEDSGMDGQRWMMSMTGVAIAALSLLGYGTVTQAAPIPDQDWDTLLTNPPDMDMFALDYEVQDPRIVTSMEVSEVGLTIPSLWWAQQLYGGRLLENWVAFPPQDNLPRRVDLVVNEQVWSIYNYIERYTFVNRLGSEARDYGYMTRVFDRAGTLLSAYICDFGAIASQEIQVDSQCRILLDAQGAGGLMGRSRSAASPSTGDGRFQR